MPEFSLTPRSVGPLEVFPLDVVAPLGVRAIITSRRGGRSKAPYASLNLALHVGDDVDSVTHNRQLVARTLEVDDVSYVEQIHSSNVADVAEVTIETRADALTTGDERAVAIMVADCVPLLVVSPRQHQLAVVHAGWRGLAAGIIEAALTQLGSSSDLVVVIGPSISGNTYQVGPEVVSASSIFAEHHVSDYGDRSLLDLRGATTTLLGHLGVASSNIWTTREVTDGGETFFSDRSHRPTGRFALVARWA